MGGMSGRRIGKSAGRGTAGNGRRRKDTAFAPRVRGRPSTKPEDRRDAPAGRRPGIAAAIARSWPDDCPIAARLLPIRIAARAGPAHPCKLRAPPRGPQAFRMEKTEK
ncbi:hypothetical protein Bpla01_22660 [Burkholderia plantarii]|nr:hypothetical protein Bpla01_22660 [Burkholderia plantarii]